MAYSMNNYKDMLKVPCETINGLKDFSISIWAKCYDCSGNS